MQRDLWHPAASHHPLGDASLPAPGLTLAWGCPRWPCAMRATFTCQGKAELGCPEELRGMQGAGPLALPGDFGKHLSCPSQLKESLATVLRKAMARLGWMRAGG